RVYEIAGGIRESSPPSKASHDAHRKTSPQRSVLLRFGHDDIDFSRVHAGDKLWKTSDPRLERDLRRTYEGEQPRFKRPISMEIFGRSAEPLTLIVRDELGHVVRCNSTMPLRTAETQPLTKERLSDQLGRLGGTPFVLGKLSSELIGEVLLPVSELNRLRREAVKQLEAQRTRPPRWALSSATDDATFDLGGSARRPAEQDASRTPSARACNLIVLVRNLTQVEAALSQGVKTVYCDFEDPKKYREAVKRFRDYAHHTAEAAIFVAPPRIF